MNDPIERSSAGGTARQAWWSGQDPAVQLQLLWGEVSRLFDRTVLGTADSARHWMPLVEEEDRGDAYIVRAELPGIPQELVRVELDGDELHISGSTEESAPEGMLRRRVGAFSYGVRVPGDADAEGIRAGLSHGVLTVLLPKSGKSARRRIDVGVNAV
ncbi:Hsp20/alpha crystallin family protein [Streptomyces exfoliatus]|uniref:Hsp20/alpha crystallin family protein n=1 Tax=Streptomyces exfoliatus TaxID=1905 RepID=A0ABV3CY39_STREX